MLGSGWKPGITGRFAITKSSLIGTTRKLSIPSKHQPSQACGWPTRAEDKTLATIHDVATRADSIGAGAIFPLASNTFETEPTVEKRCPTTTLGLAGYRGFVLP